MANRAPTIDPVLASLEAAPFVDDTDEERAHMAAVRASAAADTRPLLTTEQIQATVERMRLEEERATS